MDALINLLERFTALDIDTITSGIYKKDVVQKFIIELNTEKQIREGLNAEGDILGFYRSFSYAVSKQRISGNKAPFGQVDLYVSGRFFRTFRIIPRTGGFDIEANTSLYGDDFELIYGNVKGLTDESKGLLAIYLVDFIKKAIIKELLR